ncbi:MAG: glycosyltransferase family 2 protein [Sedimentisphaerales bacterium]|nr:glycosyltransferase family 2 protein [Sedimentisphaerales bacterium]
MPNLVKGKATICIVNYKTLEFTRLALRCIRRFTKYPYQVIVVDNDSKDESVDYLRGLKWIRLIERRTDGDISGSRSHSAALQLGYENCDTEFFVSMHSDAFVHRDDWLADLIAYFAGDERTACVGSGKLELTPRWRVLLKKATDWRTFKRRLLRTPDPFGQFRYYNRTICCLYRTEVLRKEGLSFLTNEEKGLTSGKQLYFDIVDRGYKTVELPTSVMSRYVIHLAHATQVVNPQEFALRKRTVKKCNRYAKKVMSSPTMQGIITDDSLDR